MAAGRARSSSISSMARRWQAVSAKGRAAIRLAGELPVARRARGPAGARGRAASGPAPAGWRAARRRRAAPAGQSGSRPSRSAGRCASAQRGRPARPAALGAAGRRQPLRQGRAARSSAAAHEPPQPPLPEPLHQGVDGHDPAGRGPGRAARGGRSASGRRSGRAGRAAEFGCRPESAPPAGRRGRRRKPARPARRRRGPCTRCGARPPGDGARCRSISASSVTICPRWRRAGRAPARRRVDRRQSAGGPEARCSAGPAGRSRRAAASATAGPTPGSVVSGANSGLSIGGRRSPGVRRGLAGRRFAARSRVSAGGAGMSADGGGPMGETREMRCKRLVHRSRYRGVKESDLLFGQFAARHLDAARRCPARPLRGAARRARPGRPGLGLRPGTGARRHRQRRVRAACARSSPPRERARRRRSREPNLADERGARSGAGPRAPFCWPTRRRGWRRRTSPRRLRRGQAATILHVARDGGAHPLARRHGRILRARGRDRRDPGLGLPALRPDLAQRRRSWPSGCARWRGSPTGPGTPPRLILTTANAHRAEGAAAGAGARRALPGQVRRPRRPRRADRLPRAQRLPPYQCGGRGRRLRRPRRPARRVPERRGAAACGSTSSARRWNRSAPSIP